MSTEHPAPSPAAGRLPAVPESTANGFPLSARPTSAEWWFTTLDPKTPRGRTLITRAADHDGEKLESLLGKQVEVTDVYLNPVELIDAESGEVHLRVHLCLVTPDDTLIHCVSVGAFQSVRAVWQGQGAGPWLDPLVFEARQQALAGGKRTFKLRYLGRRSELAGAVKGAKK